MANGSSTLHEDQASLNPNVLDRHRAIRSVMEEFEAVDWYSQRLEATHDPSLRPILEHNANEEKEYAAMLLEWLRRNDPVLDEHFRTYFFSESEIHNIEEKNHGR